MLANCVGKSRSIIVSSIDGVFVCSCSPFKMTTEIAIDNNVSMSEIDIYNYSALFQSELAAMHSEHEYLHSEHGLVHSEHVFLHSQDATMHSRHSNSSSRIVFS